jgi:uncharacterized membrane protein YozB (DUF420 family)
MYGSEGPIITLVIAKLTLVALAIVLVCLVAHWKEIKKVASNVVRNIMADSGTLLGVAFIVIFIVLVVLSGGSGSDNGLGGRFGG